MSETTVPRAGDSKLAVHSRTTASSMISARAPIPGLTKKQIIVLPTFHNTPVEIQGTRNGGATIRSLTFLDMSIADIQEAIDTRLRIEELSSVKYMIDTYASTSETTYVRMEIIDWNMRQVNIPFTSSKETLLVKEDDILDDLDVGDTIAAICFLNKRRRVA